MFFLKFVVMCFTEVRLQHQELFESGVARDKIILKNLARILT